MTYIRPAVNVIQSLVRPSAVVTTPNQESIIIGPNYKIYDKVDSGIVYYPVEPLKTEFVYVASADRQNDNTITITLSGDADLVQDWPAADGAIVVYDDDVFETIRYKSRAGLLLKRCSGLEEVSTEGLARYLGRKAGLGPRASEITEGTFGGEANINVGSTLGWPSSGYALIGEDDSIYYTSKNNTTLIGCLGTARHKKGLIVRPDFYSFTVSRDVGYNVDRRAFLDVFLRNATVTVHAQSTTGSLISDGNTLYDPNAKFVNKGVMPDDRVILENPYTRTREDYIVKKVNSQRELEFIGKSTYGTNVVIGRPIGNVTIASSSKYLSIRLDNGAATTIELTTGTGVTPSQIITDLNTKFAANTNLEMPTGVSLKTDAAIHSQSVVVADGDDITSLKIGDPIKIGGAALNYVGGISGQTITLVNKLNIAVPEGDPVETDRIGAVIAGASNNKISIRSNRKGGSIQLVGITDNAYDLIGFTNIVIHTNFHTIIGDRIGDLDTIPKVSISNSNNKFKLSLWHGGIKTERSFTLNYNIVTNGAFATDLTGWSGVNWAQDAGAATHTAGVANTAPLVQAAATAVVGKKYTLTYDVVGMTGGDITPSFGGSSFPAVDTSGAGKTVTFKATATTALRFTPSTDFDGSIDNVIFRLATVEKRLDVVADDIQALCALTNDDGFETNTTLASAAAINAEQITLTSSSGFIDGDLIVITESVYDAETNTTTIVTEDCTVTHKAGSVLQIKEPLVNTYTTSATVSTKRISISITPKNQVKIKANRKNDTVELRDIENDIYDTIGVHPVEFASQDLFSSSLATYRIINDRSDYREVKLRNPNEYGNSRCDFTVLGNLSNLDRDIYIRLDQGLVVHANNGVSYPVESAEAIQVSFRALKNSGTGDIVDVDELNDVETKLNRVDIRNPLAVAATLALRNSIHRIRTYAIGEDSVDGYQKALDQLKKEYKLHSMCFLSQDPAVAGMFASHVAQMSTPEESMWRIVTWSPVIPKNKIMGELNVSGSISYNETQERGVIIDGNGAYITNHVAAGDFVRVFARNLEGDAQDTTRGIYEIVEVISESKIYFRRLTSSVKDIVETVDIDTADLSSYGVQKLKTTEHSSVADNGNDGVITAASIDYEIFRKLDADGQAEQLSLIAQSYNSKRVYQVLPDKVMITLDGGDHIVPGYYLCAALVGMDASMPPHQGYTNLGITGIKQLYNSDKHFNRDQLDTLAEGGVYVVVQDVLGALPYTRHQISTDPSFLETRERSLVRNIDYVSFMFKDNLRKFLGIYNINRSTIELIRTVCESVKVKLKEMTYPRIGAPLIDAEIVSIVQNTTFKDRVDVAIKTSYPYPLNNIQVTLMI